MQFLKTGAKKLLCPALEIQPKESEKRSLEEDAQWGVGYCPKKGLAPDNTSAMGFPGGKDEPKHQEALAFSLNETVILTQHQFKH